MLNRILLYLKYFKIRKFAGKDLLVELHNKGYKQSMRIVGCTLRAELLYHILKKEGYNPSILTYSIKDNKQVSITNFEKQFKHISGDKFHKHYVVFLDGMIYDANLSLLKPPTKEDYEKYAIKYRPKSDILCMEVSPSHKVEELKDYIEHYNLSKQFQNAF